MDNDHNISANTDLDESSPRRGKRTSRRPRYR